MNALWFFGGFLFGVISACGAYLWLECREML